MDASKFWDLGSRVGNLWMKEGKETGSRKNQVGFYRGPSQPDDGRGGASRRVAIVSLP